jgi:LmbE family N-acetylglucosaminyl deacetylase
MREDRLIAYQALAGFSAKRLLVFAPHPDDEVFGCGGALALAVKAKAAIEVVIVTDGALGEAQASDHGSLAEQRARESRQAAQVIGYPEPQFWQLADRSLRYNDGLIKRIEQAIIAFAPDLVLAPSYTEVHPDHRAIAQATLAVAEAFAVKRIEDKAKRIDFDLAFYEVGQPLRPNHLIDIGSVYELKRQAMLCFASQLAQKPYAGHRSLKCLSYLHTRSSPQSCRGLCLFEARGTCPKGA